MKLIEKTVSSREIYSGKILELKLDEIERGDGGHSKREVVVHRGGVCVAALTDDGDILMVNQYRYATGGTLLELPAGKLEAGEDDPARAALRELSEETGAKPKFLYDLGWFYPSPGYTTEKIYMYAADGISIGRQHLDSGEFLDVMRVPFDEAVKCVLSGGYHDAKTDFAILKLSHFKSVGMPEPILTLV
ncbi:MAG: NUDIX hydrolase [Firmicutes bacterium]|nr:NUDIX hydrolase [Bacillota bacterium]